jgi:hypothetical protein
MVKYQASEIKQEAADLQDPADHDLGEVTHGMRKVILCHSQTTEDKSTTFTVTAAFSRSNGDGCPR